MGKYNFDEIIDRHGTSCNKWEYNIPEDVVPMWVADMNFPTVPTIQQAIIERASHPASVTSKPRRNYYKAIIRWQETRHGVTGSEAPGTLATKMAFWAELSVH